METSGVLAAPLFVIRPAGPEDLAFIFSTWLKSYLNNGPINRPGLPFIQNDLYHKKHHEIIVNILKRSVVPVACQPDAPHVVLGYAALEMTQPVCLHYIYVKLAWRRRGVAKGLLGRIDPNTCLYSHWTSALRPWAKAKYPHLMYDPYLQHPAEGPAKR